MKLHRTKQRSHALTLLEVMVVILALAVLAASLLPALVASMKKSQRITCVNHLMQIGLGSRIWENDHTNSHPLIVSTNLGGIAEYVERGEAFRYFQILSNELVSPVILACPADARQPAKDYGSSFSNTNISYFINLAASSHPDPQTVLFGDDDFEINEVRVKSGLLEIPANTRITWMAARHNHTGNIALGDGSVESVTGSGLRNYLQQAALATNRLLIP